MNIPDFGLDNSDYLGLCAGPVGVDTGYFPTADAVELLYVAI